MKVIDLLEALFHSEESFNIREILQMNVIFHTKYRRNLELLSVYTSDNLAFIEMDIGKEGE